jgi:hypothetical protein
MNAFVTLRTSRILVVTGCWIAATTSWVRAASTLPPGVPEPGLIIWGNVVNTTNVSQQIGITSASWAVTDGTNTAVYSQLTRPSVSTFTQGDRSYYVLEVPFDTRRFGTIQLDNPANQGLNSFELVSSSPPTYLLTPTINGVLASVRFIDGAPSAGSNISVAGFNAAVRGRVIRVDLSITPTTETYDQWATRIFGGTGVPSASPGADPDHDGLTNAAEYAAGTNPLDASSVLRLLQIAVTANQATVGWQSVASKQYVLESATNIVGPWTDATSVLSSNLVSQASVLRSPTDLQTFYRVRVVSP